MNKCKCKFGKTRFQKGSHEFCHFKMLKCPAKSNRQAFNYDFQ